jgi:hypothetical protein
VSLHNAPPCRPTGPGRRDGSAVTLGLAAAVLVAGLLGACRSTGRSGGAERRGAAGGPAVTVVALVERPTERPFVITPRPPPRSATERASATPRPSATPPPVPTEAVTPGAAASAAVPVDVTADEYAVLSAILRTGYAVRGQRRLVIQAMTVLPPLGAGAAAVLESSGGPDLVADFRARNEVVAPLGNKLSLPLPYTLVKREDLDRLTADPGWSAFVRQYPRANGYVGVSRVGFDAAGDMAMVYVAHSMGAGVGRGTVFVLARTAGRWEVVDAVTVWGA